MTSVCQIAPYFLPVFIWAQPGLAVPTSPFAELYLGDGGASAHRGGMMARSDSRSDSSTVSLVSPVHASAWLQDVVLKIEMYGVLADGWRGQGSLAPSGEVREQAAELAGQFAFEIPGISRPIVGADDDGAISLHWATNEMSATVTAHGDGTYSYYAENAETSDISDSEVIGSPLPRLLINIMAVEAALGTLVA